MKIDFDQIETFGPGVRAYRIVPERDTPARGGDRDTPSTPHEELNHETTRTDNANRLGDRLRERLQRHDPPSKTA
jgi:hypothetical protein